MSLIHAFLFPLIVLTPIAIAMGVVKLVFMNASHKKRLPFDISTSRRIPGQSLLAGYNDSNAELFSNLIMLVLSFNTPFIFAGISDYIGVEIPFKWSILPFCFIAMVYFLIQLVKAAKNKTNLRLGLEAEWFVSLELNEISAPNYKVFHDIQCDKFNIDHLVVGPNGVFAIETKGKRKPDNAKNAASKSKEYRVLVRGNVLEFPTYTDTSIVEQAIRQAKWASKWLSDATEEPITVSPVVTIPGWYVERVTKPTVPVVSTKTLGKYVPKLLGQALSPEQISRIVYQVNQKTLRNDNLI